MTQNNRSESGDQDTWDLAMRNVGPIRAALSNLVGFGLGYVYVGRIHFALIFLAVLIGVLAIAGWTRLVFDPYAFYLVVALALGIGLFALFHSALIASRDRTAVARRYNRWWFYLLWIVASLFISKGITSMRPVLFGFEPFSIPSSSMAPTIQQGDLVMADTWHFDRADPAYGDLVVFRVPGNNNVKYVKRTVGLPGDSIEIRSNVLFRNEEAIVEPYIQLTSDGSGIGRNFGPVVIPDEHYFVLGDNRHRARDSRYLGPIDRESLHGRLEHRWFAFREGILWNRFPERFENADD